MDEPLKPPSAADERQAGTQIDLNAIRAALATADPDVVVAALEALAPPRQDPSTYLNDPGFAAVDLHNVPVPTPHGDVPARLYRHRTERRDGALVWVHGGGFVSGDIDMPEAHWVSVSLAAYGFGVLSVDHRKCIGGVHYPAPSDDVLAAWQWAVAHADELGVPAGRLHLGGASAGGSLAAGVTKRLRDGAGPLPASLVLVYPTLHAESPPMSEELAGATAALRAAMPSSYSNG